MSSKTPIKLHTGKLSTVKESQQIQQMEKSSLRTWGNRTSWKRSSWYVKILKHTKGGIKMIGKEQDTMKKTWKGWNIWKGSKEMKDIDIEFVKGMDGQASRLDIAGLTGRQIWEN